MVGTDNVEGLKNAGLAIIAVGVLIVGLVYGSPILIPLAIAIFLWAVLEAMIQGFARLRIGGYGLPPWLASLLGVGSIALGLYLIVSILLGQVDALAAAWPRYVDRLQSILSGLTEWLGPERSAKLQQMMADIDLTRRIPGLLASTQSLIVSLLLILAYIGFMIAERGYVQSKIAAMFPHETRAKEASQLLAHISESFQRYIWIKTIISLLTGVSCYVVLRWLGIDFAETWALLIFALNYIPNIGSIVAVAFPAMIALVQFETPTMFLILVATLTAIQIAIGSIIEPLMMGSSLNMSPLAIILNLAFWGSVWGIAGMFLSVPILVVIMIVCASVPSWRWVAILLSKDGSIGPRE
jgi:predicted PurR-regulated permease PerM